MLNPTVVINGPDRNISIEIKFRDLWEISLAASYEAIAGLPGCMRPGPGR